MGDNFEHLVFSGNTDAIGRGNAANNTMLGNNGNNQLFGEAGNGWLDGKIGVDTMEGGVGNDVYIIDNPLDVIVELAGEGVDKVTISHSTIFPTNVYHLADEIEVLVVQTGSCVVYANDDANTITSNESSEVHGQGGDDVININVPSSYTRGNTVYGDDGNDLITSSTSGVDRVDGGGIEGGAGNDKIIVITQSVLIHGDAGNDIIELKNAGGSVVYGGLGNDLYVIDKKTLTSPTDHVFIGESLGEGVDTVQTESSLSLDALDVGYSASGVFAIK